MRRAWVSLAAAAMLVGCIPNSDRWVDVAGTVTADGVEMTMLDSRLVDEQQPWRKPPEGMHCAAYVIRVRAVDGARHELRPEDFKSGGKLAGSGVGYCSSGEMEPVWVDANARDHTLTVLERELLPLQWRSR